MDGIIESGEAAVDQSSITGEFLPVNKRKKDQAFAGTVVKSGRLVICAEKVGDETTVGRIIHMVEEASHHKATIQFYADRFSAQFIPVNFALAIIVYLVTKNFSRALNMLIIDYSCGYLAAQSLDQVFDMAKLDYEVYIQNLNHLVYVVLHLRITF